MWRLPRPLWRMGWCISASGGPPVGGTVYALNASTGALLWSNGIGNYGVLQSSPAVANGVVYVGTTDTGAGVAAMDASTGALLWSYSPYGVFQSSPAVANGVVYVGSGGLVAPTYPVPSLRVHLCAERQHRRRAVELYRWILEYVSRHCGWGALHRCRRPSVLYRTGDTNELFRKRQYLRLLAAQRRKRRSLPADKTHSGDRPTGRPDHLCLPGMESRSGRCCSGSADHAGSRGHNLGLRPHLRHSGAGHLHNSTLRGNW